MAKEKLSDKVQAHIDAKRFDTAITLLANIDSPRATEWIHRIKAQQVIYQRQSQQRVLLWMALVFFACLFSCIVFGWNG